MFFKRSPKEYFDNYEPAGFGYVKCKLCRTVISSNTIAIRGHEANSAKHKLLLNIERLRKAGYEDIKPAEG